MNLVAKLFSSDEAAVDSVIWCSVVGVLGLVTLAFYEAIMGHPPGITETGTGLATVIGAAGAVRVSRERLCK